ncbi:Plasma-membrane choline transporter [Seminavis robusta]|uniref:Plasma-membrane choline transporter n=1 Tax=Seminavis robusta TaxID=568900 RepID=A0A9N8F2M6_9STRA|nr:Plasma-membrane choline transporter [Seminavis robusta]|eukprot:Sro3075_g343300.1 Plasma-membrane choline transporter (862) ;mRNA; f:6066-8651
MREGKRSYFRRDKSSSSSEEQRDRVRGSSSSSREAKPKSKAKRMFSRKAKKRKKSSKSQKMASETTALSPTTDNHKAVDVKHQHFHIPQKFKFLDTPTPQQTTDESTDTGTDQDDFGVLDEQDENVNLVSTEHSYISDNDPYIYSDDSESFSDAYFRPQISDYPAVLYPRSSSHGSFTSSFRDEHRIGITDEGPWSATSPPPLPPGNPINPFHNNTPPHALNYSTVMLGQATSDRSGSPFKHSGSSIASILEDSPADEEQQQLLGDDLAGHHYYGGLQNTLNIGTPAGAAEADAQYLRQTKKERRKIRKQQKAAARQRQMQMLQNQKQREQAVRERTVSEVKGRPQDETVCRDSVYAYVFVVHLLLVFALAVNSGTTVMFSKDAATWGTIAQTSKTNTNTATNTKTTFFQRNKAKRRLLDRIFIETADYPLFRRLDSPLLDTGNTISKNSSLHDVLLKKNDTKDLLSDDAIAPEDSKSSSSSSSSSSYSTKTPTSPPAPTPNKITDPTSFTIDYRNAIALLGVSGFYACILSYLSFGFMLIMSRALIQVTLVFSIILSLAWGMLGLTIDPYGVISIMGFGALLLTLGYTIYNWQRVPFASTNLHTALCAMRCTSDITLLGMGAILVAFAWTVVWGMAFIGAVDTFDPNKCTNQSLCVFEIPLIRFGLYGFFIISFYWTNAVIKNILRVTVASAIGTWWYYPQEISPICSPAVGQPLLRSLTKSLGSICLGSLVSRPLQCIHMLGQCFFCMCNFRRHTAPTVFSDEADEEGETREKETMGGGDVESALVVPATPTGTASLNGSTVSKDAKPIGSRLRCFNHPTPTLECMATTFAKAERRPSNCLKHVNGWKLSETTLFRTCF